MCPFSNVFMADFYVSLAEPVCRGRGEEGVGEGGGGDVFMPLHFVTYSPLVVFEDVLIVVLMNCKHTTPRTTPHHTHARTHGRTHASTHTHTHTHTSTERERE